MLSYLVTRWFTYVCIYVILLMFFCWCLKGKYAEALCDAKAGKQFNPTYLEAIERGESFSDMKRIAVQEFASATL